MIRAAGWFRGRVCKFLRRAALPLAALPWVTPAGPIHAAPPGKVEPADTLLRGGVFYTVAAPGANPGSLAVRGGRIVALGSDTELAPLRGPKTRVIELGGRAVTPGWIDAHSHLIGLGRSLEAVDLRGVTSFDELVRRVAVAARELPEGTWIYGRGWDQNLWPGKQFPSHHELSRATPKHPVWLTRIDGHAALWNELAMSRLGLSDAITDPTGGRFERDAAGKLTGVAVDAAMRPVGATVPTPSAADVARALARGAEASVARGLTTVTDMGVGALEIASYEEAGARLPLRVAVFLTDDGELQRQWFARGPLVHPSGRLTVRGLKLYSDGALGSRGAALIEPYADDPKNSGLLVSSGDHVEEVARRALDAGFQVGVHAIGDRGNLVTLDALERALGGPRPEVRFRIEHAQVMRLQDIERMARLGVIGSVQPTHATSDMPWAEARVGARRIEGAYAFRRLLDAGARLALGSDFPVEEVDPLLGLYSAVTRQDLAGLPAGGWRASEKLTRAEALRGFTLDAAYSLFLDSEVGSIEVGKRADLVVFDRDPMSVAESEIPKVRVDLTLVDGEVVYRRETKPPTAGRSGGKPR